MNSFTDDILSLKNFGFVSAVGEPPVKLKTTLDSLKECHQVLFSESHQDLSYYINRENMFLIIRIAQWVGQSEPRLVDSFITKAMYYSIYGNQTGFFYDWSSIVFLRKHIETHYKLDEIPKLDSMWFSDNFKAEICAYLEYYHNRQLIKDSNKIVKLLEPDEKANTVDIIVLYCLYKIGGLIDEQKTKYLVDYIKEHTKKVERLPNYYNPMLKM